jgi:type IV pilus assembly protein PilB
MKQGLGAILVDAGLITQAQLDESLELQKVYGEKLASILVRQSHLTEKFAVSYLGRQLGVPAVDLSRHAISLDLLRLVSFVVCSQKMVFPVQLQDGHLQLAMADPLDQGLIAELSREHQVRLRPCIALEASIKNAIEEAGVAVRAGRRVFTPSALHRRLTTFSLDPGRRSLPPGTGPLPVVTLEEGHAAPIVEKLGGEVLAYDKSFTGTGLRSASAPPSLGPTEARAAEEPAPVEEPATCTVVLVDSNPSTRRAMSDLLGGSKALRVVGVSSAAEALSLLADVALLIVRRGLPGEHPLELCRQARALSADLRVVLITPTRRGWAYQTDVRDAFGVDLVLEPPLDGPHLRDKAEQLVGLGRGPDPERESAVKECLKAGVANLKRNNIDDAIEALQAGLRQDPRSDLLHYYLGMAYERSNRPEDAIESYEQAIETNPEFEDALVSLAILYERAGMRRKSVEIWQRVLSASPEPSSRERIKSRILQLL